MWGCMFASFLLSLKMIGNKNIPPYMRKFYWYTIIAASFSLYNFFQIYFSITSKNASGFFHSSLLLFHFIFLSHFIHSVFPNKKLPKSLKLLFFLFLVLIVTCLLVNDLSKPQSSAYVFTNFGLVIFCCWYYFQLFLEMPMINLFKLPSFWVISGVFFCMCATIPLNALRGYLFDTLPYESYLSLGALLSISYGTMHLFFIKAYLCSPNQPQV